jgi:methylglutamate dehydrogenase subunit B
MLVPCPHCGIRPVEEFTFLGDAKPVRPNSTDGSAMEQWYDYVYLRDNPRGAFEDYVHHSGGCRQWMVLKRDTETHDVGTSVPAREYKR